MSEMIRQSLPRDARVGLTAGLLTWVAVNAKAIQFSAVANMLPHYAETTVNSMAHPVLGYMGACIGFYYRGMNVQAKPHIQSRLRGGAIGAVATNFAFELGQSLTIASESSQNFMSVQNAPETLKDFAFALAGMGILMFQERRAIWQRTTSRQ